MGFPLALLIFATAAGEAPAEGCPVGEAVAAEIGRMGAAGALALTGTSEISVQGASMQIVLRGLDGTTLGTRQVAAPAACQERAVVAAVVIVAWLGEWAGAEPRAQAPHRPAGPMAAAPLVARPPPRTSRPAERRAELAAFAFGADDGAAGTWGLGLQAGYELLRPLWLTTLGEATGERAVPLGPGQAAYRSIRVGVGAGARWWLGRAFIDGGVTPEGARLSLRGVGLSNVQTVTAWGLAVDARVRFGVRVGRLVPFIYADAGYALTAARLTLDNSSDSATLSRWDFAAGLGVLFSFNPSGG